MTRYPLGLEPNYVPDWTLTDAVREFFQNAKDQEVTDPTNEMYFEYIEGEVHLRVDDEYQEPGILYIGNKISVLSIRSLLMGSSSKRDDPNTIGQFGEGYKVAALVLLRLGKEIKIYNYGAKEVWTFRIVNSKQYKGPIVVVDVDKKFFWQSVPHNNLIITIQGITAEEYGSVKETNLHINPAITTLLTSYGSILLDEELKGKVFVNGLWVCTKSDYVYGYNLKPQYIKLNRDRKAVDGWDLKWTTGKMWVESGSPLIEGLAKSSAPDVEGIVYHMNSQSTNFAVEASRSFTQEHGKKASPVTSQNEADTVKRAGRKPIIVSEAYKKIVDTGHHNDAVVMGRKIGRSRTKAPVILTFPQRFEKWFRKYKDRFDIDAQVHFREILSDLKKEVKK